MSLLPSCQIDSQIDYMRYIAGTVYFLHTAYYDLEKLDSVQAK